MGGGALGNAEKLKGVENCSGFRYGACGGILKKFRAGSFRAVVGEILWVVNSEVALSCIYNVKHGAGCQGGKGERGKGGFFSGGALGFGGGAIGVEFLRFATIVVVPLKNVPAGSKVN